MNQIVNHINHSNKQNFKKYSLIQPKMTNIPHKMSNLPLIIYIVGSNSNWSTRIEQTYLTHCRLHPNTYNIHRLTNIVVIFCGCRPILGCIWRAKPRIRMKTIQRSRSKDRTTQRSRRNGPVSERASRHAGLINTNDNYA